MELAMEATRAASTATAGLQDQLRLVRELQQQADLAVELGVIRAGDPPNASVERNQGGDKRRAGWHECSRDDVCPYCDQRDTDGACGFGWDRFAMMACICLQERPDRLAMSSAEFHRIGACRDVFYFRPTKPKREDVTALGYTRSDALGSWESHRTVAQRALQLDVFRTARAEAEDGRVPAIIIFEDDVVFLKPVHRAVVDRICQTIATLPQDWDMLMLGHFPLPVPGTCRPLDALGRHCSLRAGWQTWRVHSLMLHAYVLSERGAQKLAAVPYHAYNVVPWGMPGEHFLDAWLCQNAVQYAMVPMLCGQADSASDQPVSGKESGIRLHTRLARKAPGLLEILFMVLPFITLLVLAVAVILVFLSALRPRTLAPSLFM